MNIVLSYTLESELARLRGVIDRQDFYRQNDYRVDLPAGFSLYQDAYTGIEIAAKREFASPKLKQARSQLTTQWAQYSKQLSDLFSSLSTAAPALINIQLTQYGTGGSYMLPNTVIININQPNLFKVLVHETVHCLTEINVVQKYRLNHQQKEGLVDWLFINNPILKNIFSDYAYQKRSQIPDRNLLVKIGWQ